MIPTRDAGFTLVETLVATVLTMAVAGAVLSLANPGMTIGHAQPEASDMHQRARVAADTLHRDLIEAGAGLDTGARAGSLVQFLPPIVPRRLGLAGADAPHVVRADAVTLTRAVAGFAQTTTASVVAGASASLVPVNGPPCAPADALCGLAEGADALVFDELGNFDMFRVVGLLPGTADLRRHAAGAAHGYQPGAFVTAAETRIYYFDVVNRQLRVSDGYLSDAPVIDNVVGLTFSYFGDPEPPLAPKPPAGTPNCLYDAAGRVVGAMPRLSTAGGSLAPLPLAMLNDGPWCGGYGTQFDADLLRIRQVRVSLRVQTGKPQFRAAGALFAIPGTARQSSQLLPDYVVTLDVAPRNMVPRGAPWP
jgi:hypothetical protein